CAADALPVVTRARSSRSSCTKPSFAPTAFALTACLTLINSCSRQEVDRVNDGHGRHFLRAEVERLDAIHDLRGKVRRIHVGRMQLAERHAAIRLDGEP